MTSDHRKISSPSEVDEQALRSVLDTISSSDICAGWRTIPQIAEDLCGEGHDVLEYQRAVSQFLCVRNKMETLFEIEQVDNEFCVRSHKFNLARESFQQALENFKAKVKATPEKANVLLIHLQYSLPAALKVSAKRVRQYKEEQQSLKLQATFA